jgi:hypothetical protein
MRELFDNMDLDIGHVALHHFAHSYFIPDVVEHVWELTVPDPVVLLESDQEVLFFGSEEFSTSDDVLEVLNRDNAVFHDINLLEEVFKKFVALLNFVPVDELKGIRVGMFHFFGLLLSNVTSVEGLDGTDTDWNELIPVDELVLVFISKSNKHVDIVIV